MRRRGPLVCALVAATVRAADWPEKYLGAKGDQYNDDCRICEHKKYPQCDQGIWLNGTGCPPVYDKAGEVTTLSNVDEDGVPVALRKNDEEVLVDNAAAFCASDCKYILIGEEVLEVTSIDGNVLTVVRGFDGTQKAYHVAGSTIYLLNSLSAIETWMRWNSTKRLFPSNGGKLKYKNFPWRWSGAVGVWKMDETTIEREYPDPDQWRERKEAKECSEECRRRVPFPAPPTRRGAPQAVLRREEAGLLRTEHQRHRLRLPRLRTVLQLLALVLLPLCAGLQSVQPAGGAPRRQDGGRSLRLCVCHLRSLIICYGARTSPTHRADVTPVLELVGGAAGGRHRASPIHRRLLRLGTG